MNAKRARPECGWYEELGESDYEHEVYNSMYHQMDQRSQYHHNDDHHLIQEGFELYSPMPYKDV